jgi:DNA-binding MarR family transcriptional regulator
LRTADIGWRLGISQSAATRLLDRAEIAALVDRFVVTYDRRGIDVRLTSTGRALQHDIQRIIERTQYVDRKRGRAYGRRATDPWDPD